LHILLNQTAAFVFSNFVAVTQYCLLGLDNFHITTHRYILISYFNNCNFSKQSNAVPDDGVTAPKHVGAVLMSILKLFLSQFTCSSVGE